MVRVRRDGTLYFHRDGTLACQGSRKVPRNEEVYIQAWLATGICSLIVILVTLFGEAEAGDLKLGLMLASDHLDGTYDCDGEDRSVNESNPGLYAIYKGVLVGRYENSHSGCGVKYSNLVGYQFELGRYRNLEFSVTAAVADGYRDFDDDKGQYRSWASINMKWNLFGKGGPKMFYAYYVAAYSLEGEI
jgi:hypothetical protein